MNGLPADYYESTAENDSNILFWFDEEHNLMFQINSRLDRDTILRIAENIVLAKTP